MKTKWKRWLCLLCAAALILGVFSACGSSSESSSEASVKEESEEADNASAEAEESEPAEEPEEAEEAEETEPEAEPEAPAEPAADIEYSPVTISDYEEYLSRCVDAGLKSPIGANIISWIGTANLAYDIPGMTNVSGELDAGQSLYHIGDTVYSALEEDSSLREYVTLMHDWYEKGYFYNDIISMGNGGEARGQSDDLIYGGDVGVIAGGLETCNEFYSRRADESMTISPARTMILEEGQTIHYGENELTTSGTGSAVITSGCEDIEAACRFMDWFYTDMGIETINYGPEGLTWN